VVRMRSVLRFMRRSLATDELALRPRVERRVSVRSNARG
jgi:hypothetical protein